MRSWRRTDAELELKTRDDGTKVDLLDIDEMTAEPLDIADHPNVRKLAERMDRAMQGKDWPLVLHTAASMFETVARQMVPNPGVQNQSLGGWFSLTESAPSLSHRCWTQSKRSLNGVTSSLWPGMAPSPMLRLPKGSCAGPRVNDLRVFAARSRRGSSVGRTRGVEGDRALWRFQPGRLMPGPRITGQEARPEEPDQDIAAQGEAFVRSTASSGARFGILGCDGDSGTLWRAEARSDKTRQRQRRAVRIMVPWPAVG